MDALDAAVLAEVAVVLAWTATHSPNVQRALKLAGEQLDAHAPQAAELQRRVRKQEAAIRRLDGELATATRTLLGGRISQRAYDVTVARIEAERTTAEEELAALHATAARGTTPSLVTLLEQADQWLLGLKDQSVARKRALLGEMLQTVTPVRLGGGRYAGRLRWSERGRHVFDLAAKLRKMLPAQEFGDVTETEYAANAAGQLLHRGDVFTHINLLRGPELDKEVAAIPLAVDDRLAQAVLGALVIQKEA
jgi:hypothetical protein